MPTHNVEVRSGKHWVPLGNEIPRALESRTLRMRGLHPHENFSLGPVPYRADNDGQFKLRPVEDQNLCGHLGLVEVSRESGSHIGEIEILPDKMSESAFRVLRADLERTWTHLLFDSEGPSRVRGQLPPPKDLWRIIEQPVREIALEPRSVLTSAPGVRRMESVRRPCELTPALLRAHARQRPGLSHVLSRETDIPENRCVAEALRRLVSYARRHAEGKEVATLASQMLRKLPFANSCRSSIGLASVRSLTLRDERYRRVERVLRILDRPEAHATEGPGELRLGVRAITRLYEFWVFLQVLVCAQRRYGRPLHPGFAVLGRQTDNGTTRLVLSEGTTVRFPGDVSVGFEPRIYSSGNSWQELENVPHPDANLAQHLITPDVVVLRRGPRPEMVILDAKYVGLRWIELQAARLHAKYSRIRLHGEPIVRNVIAAHPHEGIKDLWAGYGSVPMIPGRAPVLEYLLPGA